MGNYDPASDGKVAKRVGDFMWTHAECGVSLEGWLLTNIHWRVVRDDCGLVLKRINVESGEKEVAFFYGGSLVSCLRKYEEAEKAEEIKWRRDRY